MPVQDLRFGLELELAQLFLQARDGAAEFGEVELDRADLLLQARAEDAHFAGVVEQGVEQVGVDARKFLALLRLRFAAAAAVHGCGNRCSRFRAARRGASGSAALAVGVSERHQASLRAGAAECSGSSTRTD